MRAGPTCEWCGEAYEPGGRGEPRRFCSDRCRAALHRAARRWALGELEAGRVTVAQLKEGLGKTVYGCSRGLGAPGPGVGKGEAGASRRPAAAAAGEDEDARFV